MNKKILIAALALAGCTSNQSNTNPLDKVVFVDNTKLLNEYNEKKDVESALKKKIDSYTKKRDSLSKVFQAEAQKFEAAAKTMAPNVAQQNYAKLMQKSQSLQQGLMQEEQAIQLESQQKMDTLIKKVKEFIKNYGKEKGYEFILGSNDGGSVLYGNDKKDITNDVVKAMNDKYKK